MCIVSVRGILNRTRGVDWARNNLRRVLDKCFNLAQDLNWPFSRFGRPFSTNLNRPCSRFDLIVLKICFDPVRELLSPCSTFVFLACSIVLTLHDTNLRCVLDVFFNSARDLFRTCSKLFSIVLKLVSTVLEIWFNCSQDLFWSVLDCFA